MVLRWAPVGSAMEALWGCSEELLDSLDPTPGSRPVDPRLGSELRAQIRAREIEQGGGFDAIVATDGGWRKDPSGDPSLDTVTGPGIRRWRVPHPSHTDPLGWSEA